MVIEIFEGHFIANVVQERHHHYEQYALLPRKSCKRGAGRIGNQVSLSVALRLESKSVQKGVAKIQNIFEEDQNSYCVRTSECNRKGAFISLFLGLFRLVSSVKLYAIICWIAIIMKERSICKRDSFSALCPLFPTASGFPGSPPESTLWYACWEKSFYPS